MLAIVALFFALASFGQTDIYKSALFGTGYIVTSDYNHNGISDNNSHVRTFEVWAKTDTIFTHTDKVIYNALGGNSAAWYDMYLIKVNDTTLTCKNGSNVIQCSYPADTNWHNIVFECDTIAGQDTLTIFIDGTAINGLRAAHSGVISGITNNQIIGQSIGAYGSPTGHDWYGNLCKFVIADTILYTSSFVPDCVFDTVSFWSGGTISYPYIMLAPMSIDSNIYYPSYITPDTVHTYYYAGHYTLGSSPCAPIYTFYCPAVCSGSETIKATQSNKSYKKGAHLLAHVNGWTGVTTSLTYGSFIDSMLVTATAVYPYTDDYHNIVTVDTLITVASTGVNNVYNINDIQVYPNPSTGDFNVVVSNPVQISIYDLTGHIVYMANVSDKTMIHLSQGMYICTTTNKITNVVHSTKVLIE